MNNSIALTISVSVMFFIILLAVLLKKWNILQKEHSVIFSKLVVKVTLPALIFSSLASTRFHTEFLLMALVMLIVEIISMLLAFIIARMLKFSRGQTGALILVSAFGMTAMLGYPLISMVFPGDNLAMEEAVVTSEIGVGFLLFISGPLIAMFFGQSAVHGGDMVKSAKSFFISPIFIALIAGIGISFIRLDESNQIYIPVKHFLSLIGNANTLLVALAVGLVLEVSSPGKYLIFLGIAGVIKLIIKPLIAYTLLQHPQFTDPMKEIVFIETAMPSAMLGVVFAKHYDCMPELASMSVVTTLILSLLTVSLMFLLLF
jgi:predicted permease